MAGFAALLSKKIRKDQLRQLGSMDEKDSASVASFKEALMGLQDRALPRAKVWYTVDTDAFDYRVWYVLVEEHGNRSNHPVGYWSRTFSDKELKLATTQREPMAVKWAVTLLCPYFKGIRCTIQADHEPLR